MKKFDLFVIGTGVSGTAIANACAREGLTVGITDERPYGGTCVMRGCIPKKVIFHVSKVLESAARLKGKGIDRLPSANWRDLIAFKQTFVDPIPASKENNFQKNGITTLHGPAKFLSDNQLQIGTDTIEAGKIVIATGAKPRNLGIPGEEQALTSDDFLDFKELPSSLLFIGGGYISFEFAHMAARCGAKVTIIHQGDQPLENFEQNIVKHLVRATRNLGIELILDTEVTGIKKTGPAFTVTAKDKQGRSAAYEAEAVFNTSGRVPAIRNLDLDKAGISYSKKGIEVNEFLQSISNPRVYAAGDASASAGLPLTPLASAEANIVAANVLKGNHQKAEYREMPTVVFTIPVLASVGYTEKQANDKKISFRVNQASVPDWFSAKSIHAEEYAYKILIEKDSGKILGAHLLGPHAEETINLFAMAIQAGMTASGIRNLILTFPSSASDISSMV